MAFCKNCGAELDEGAKFCASCGTAQAEEEKATTENAAEEKVEIPEYVAPDMPPKASGVLNVAQLVWSIINIIMCCMPLGVVALIFTITAKDAPSTEEEAKKLKTAKTCNLIATIGGVVINVLLFVFSFILGLMGAMGI